MTTTVEPENPRVRTLRRRAMVGIGLLAGIATFASLSRPLSFDEMYWLTMARRIFGAGDLPYFDLLDNKGPLLYVVFGAADAVPLGGRGSLTVLFVAVVVSVAVGARRLALSRGQSPGWALFSAGLVMVSMMALSVWAITTEIMAGALLIWSLTISRPWWKLVFVLAACLIDPRAILFAPIILIDGTRRDVLDRKHLTVFGVLATSALATVLVVPELRYAFVEASLATRFDANAVDLTLVTIAALTPILVVTTLRFHRVPPVAIALLTVALLIGFSAGLPYGHYWVYAALAVPLLPISGRRFSAFSTGVVTAAALLAVTLSTRDHLLHDVSQADLNGPLAAGIEQLVDPEDRVLIWASSPHLRYPIAEQTLGFAPTSNYFAWGLPELPLLLQRLDDDLAKATVLVVHPGLEAYRGFPGVEQALDRIAVRADNAACRDRVEEMTVYRFEGC